MIFHLHQEQQQLFPDKRVGRVIVLPDGLARVSCCCAGGGARHPLTRKFIITPRIYAFIGFEFRYWFRDTVVLAVSRQCQMPSAISRVDTCTYSSAQCTPRVHVYVPQAYPG